ncbi:MAG: tetratricopeptide repeat protein [Idiomarina sp.]|nr:tetratricopeptide repeat protein [Idiomarina sp.]
MTKWFLFAIPILLLAGCGSTPEPAPYAHQQGQQLLERGVTSHQRGDYVDAAYYFTRALAQYRSLDHREGMLNSHLNLAETSFLIGRLPIAAEHASSAQALAELQRDREATERAQIVLARIALEQNSLDDAAALIEHIVPPTATRPTEHAALLILADIGIRNEPRDHHYISHAERIHGTPLFQARVMRLHAQMSEEPQLIGQLLRDALDQYRELSFRPGIAATLEEMGQFHQQRGDYEAAEYRLQRALYVRAWLSDGYRSANLLEQLAALYERLDRFEEAEYSREQAASIRQTPASVRLLRLQSNTND